MSGQIIGPIGVLPTAGGLTTIYQTSFAGNNGLTSGATLWVRAIPGFNGASQVRVTFVSGSVDPLGTDHCSIGIWNNTANLFDTVSTPVELKFSTASGFNLGSNSTITSDWATFGGFTTANELVVIADLNANGWTTRDTGSPTIGTASHVGFKAATASWNTTTLATVTDLGVGPFLFAMIEVQ